MPSNTPLLGILNCINHTLATKDPNHASGFIDQFSKDPQTALSDALLSRVFSAVLSVFAVSLTCILCVVEWPLLNIEIIYERGLDLIELLKVNLIFLKVIILGVGSPIFAIVFYELIYNVFKSYDALEKAICELQVQYLPPLETIAWTTADINIRAFEDGGARLQNFRYELHRFLRITSDTELPVVRGDAFQAGLRRYLESHYSPAEVDDTIGIQIRDTLMPNDIESESLLSKFISALMNRGLIPRSFLTPTNTANIARFHELLREKLNQARHELISLGPWGKDTPDTIECMVGDSYYALIDMAILCFIREAHDNSYTLEWRGEKDVVRLSLSLSSNLYGIYDSLRTLHDIFNDPQMTEDAKKLLISRLFTVEKVTTKTEEKRSTPSQVELTQAQREFTSDALSGIKERVSPDIMRKINIAYNEIARVRLLIDQKVFSGNPGFRECYKSPKETFSPITICDSSAAS